MAWRFRCIMSSVRLCLVAGLVLVAFFVACLACLGAPAASGCSDGFPAHLIRFANCWSAVCANRLDPLQLEMKSAQRRRSSTPAGASGIRLYFFPLRGYLIHSFPPPPSVTVEGLFLVGVRLRSNLSIFCGYALQYEHIWLLFLGPLLSC